MSINLETATIQEAVDYSVQQIVKQGDRCISDNGTGCRYGNSKGQHCAIGWLLDPNKEDLMEAYGAMGSIIVHLEQDHNDPVTLTFLRVHRDVLSILQGFHDSISRAVRVRMLDTLVELKIDITGEWFEQWVVIGEYE